jgi:hypothetical protein
MIVDQPVAVVSREHTEAQRLYSVSSAARVLGVTEAALRAQVFRDRVRVVNLGRRVFVTADELDRLSGRTA